ncbi:hypothetical protein ACLB2K_073659 [Fragaria x ananassa]
MGTWGLDTMPPAPGIQEFYFAPPRDSFPARDEAGTMPPRRRPRVTTSTNANEGEEVRGSANSIGAMLRGVLDAYSWVDKMEMTFESTELPEEKKVEMAVSFLYDSAHHWWTLARKSNDGAQTMTWEQFKTLFLDKLIGVIFLTFLDTVGAAMAIEIRGTYSARPRDFSGPSQGPSKKAASSSAFGSSAGIGSSGGPGYGPRSRNRGRFRRPIRS